jgi:hypothetical protein
MNIRVIYDGVSAAHALGCSLDPPMRAALEAEIALLTACEHDLTDWTDIALIQPGDSEDDIGQEVGFSPLTNPISNVRFGEPGFEPGWDHLSIHGGVFRFVFTFGSTHATILLVPDADDILPELLTLCRQYAAQIEGIDS